MATEKATEKTTSANNSRICALDCAPKLHKNDDDSDVIDCPSEKLTASKCYLPRDFEDSFYEAVDWDKLASSFNDWMGYFVEDEINRDPFLAAKIKKAYKYGPIRDKRGVTARRFGRVNFKMVDNDSWKKCKNMIIKITLQSGRGLKVQNLAHISLHPMLPFYHRDKTRSRSGCGFYLRGAPATTLRASSPACSDASDDSGPFHYKVDTLYWRQKEFNCGDDNIPTVIFHVDPEKPGYFLENRINDLTPAIREHRYDIVLKGERAPVAVPDTVAQYVKSLATQMVDPGADKTEKKKIEKMLQSQLKSALAAASLASELPDNAEGSLTSTIAEQIKLLNEIHTEIARKFLRFWNRCIVKGKVRESNDYPGFNSSLKNAYRPAGPPCKAAPSWNSRKTSKRRSNVPSTRRSKSRSAPRSGPTTRRSRQKASEKAKLAWTPRPTSVPPPGGK
jgi:hypothetical protein